ncbi:polysaccharide biosynthesis protein (plasmid) [Rhizobium grahamii]|uniref:Polysaccharide biosynthesis protein n=1 Tax=Rhizobium grahamii TaxID=1120045 RepID=A0A5Q0CFV6_9HYPH|nr:MULTISPECIES: nucleoside-diphosphate sugar epimerase/dehydratase [Rhizobium]QFY62867.1 polysaccharide biosynthesis protein [Rhizobium grahamii]QRM52385.1 polysaccharide biosynthesis protein [Rhizobium sp. BG6]
MVDSYTQRILAIPRPAKRLVALIFDAGLCVLTVWLAFCFRFNDWYALSGVQYVTIPVSLLIALPLFVTSGLYRAIFRFIGWAAFVTVIKCVAIYGLLYMVIFTVVSIPTIPRTVGILQPLLLLLAVGLSRFVARYFLYDAYNRILRQNTEVRTLVYGTGPQGRQLVSALGHGGEFKVVGFLDDDPGLQGNLINGVKVFNPATILKTCAELRVRTVLLALPQIDRARRNEIIETLRSAKVAVRTVPDIGALAVGRAQLTDLQDLDIEDLLGRSAVPPNPSLLEQNVKGRVVLVTGAAGSIGSQLCREIAKLQPSALLLLDQNEYGIYALHNELSGDVTEDMFPIVPLLASVCDEARIKSIFDTWQPATVYHAAAYKHVPLVEQNPAEGVKTNVFGTLTVSRAAVAAGVDRLILVSTDKAVRPTNIMGATKRLAEMVLQAQAAQSSTTTFSMVRFGNVLGSSGSVVPLFRQQIGRGGPITLTHAEITRFFMTVPEAAQLVIQAGAMAKGGDVYLLDMGEPVKIIDLARRMVELSGLTVRDDQNPAGDIEIVTTGLRPGEKLYEELLISDNPEFTEHPKIRTATEHFMPWPGLSTKLDELRDFALAGDAAALRVCLSELVSGYRPFEKVVDLVSLRQELAP